MSGLTFTSTRLHTRSWRCGVRYLSLKRRRKGRSQRLLAPTAAAVVVVVVLLAVAATIVGWGPEGVGYQVPHPPTAQPRAALLEVGPPVLLR
jgi:hypothetical protein